MPLPIFDVRDREPVFSDQEIALGMREGEKNGVPPAQLVNMRGVLGARWQRFLTTRARLAQLCAMAKSSSSSHQTRGS